MRSHELRTGRRLVLGGSVVGLVAATGLAVVTFFGASPPERGIGLLSFPLLWAMPALLALLSLRSRPVLLVPAAVTSFFASFSSFSGLTLVLLVPALCFVGAFGLRHRQRWTPRLALAMSLPVLASTGAFAVLLAESGSVCWTFVEDARGERAYTDVACDETGDLGPILPSGPATTILPDQDADSGTGSGSSGSGAGSPGIAGSGGGSASNTITELEAAASVAFIAVGLAAGWKASRPGGGVRSTGAPTEPGHS